MYLTRYRPHSLLDRMVSWDRDFPFSAPRPAFEPRVDVIEHDKEYVVALELPGVSREDISVTIETDYLKIRGEKKVEHEESRDNGWRGERAYGSFSRSFRLGDGVDRDKISSDFREGVLNVTVPKSKDSVKKTIEIKVK